MKPHEEGLIRISGESDPETIDPRRARNLHTMTLLRMLYEGLVRLEPNGELKPALASRIEVSSDEKVYTFYLREAYWSNGNRIEAEDFVYAWKSMLAQDFPAPNAYQLFPIKKARAIKEGNEFVDALGVFAKNSETLVIELENPTAEFLQLLSTPVYFPINNQWAKDQLENEGSWNPIEAPYNGPFVLKEWSHNDEIIAVKNPNYWDANSVKLKKIHWIIADNYTAIQLFDKDELDWAGSPLSTIPIDVLSSLKSKGCIETIPADGVFFLRLNTQRIPFSNAKIRHAFSMAIDRKAIVEKIAQLDQPVTTALVPSFYDLKTTSENIAYNPIKALLFLNEGLKELGLTSLPSVSLCYTHQDRENKIAQAMQHQWKLILGVDVQLPNCERKMALENIRKGDYTLASGSWFADYHDASNYLEVFKYKNNGTNNTGWENTQYIELLNQAAGSTNEKRRVLLEKAQNLLLEELPIIPLYEATFSYMKKLRVRDLFLSPLGYLDFKHAYIAQYTIDVEGKE